MRTNVAIAIAFVLIICGLVVSGIFHSRAIRTKIATGKNETYSLNFLSGMRYQSSKPVSLQFTIQDDTDTTYKDFDRSNPIPLMVTVVRTDRTNFQHVHPMFNQANGTFTINPFTFPVDGEYRIYASFWVGDGNVRGGEQKQLTTVHQDVFVGNVGGYMPLPLAGEQFISNVDGYDTSIVASADNSPSIGGSTFMAGQTSKVSITITQNGQPFKGLDSFRGSVGRLTAFGPQLEFVGVNSLPIDVNEQTGTLIFNVNFPTAGLYKLYMEVQVNKKVTAFEYIVSVSPSLDSDSSLYQPMMNMDYLSQ